MATSELDAVNANTRLDATAGFIAAHSTLCQAAADLERAVKEKAQAHPVARRLMTVPGVGPVVALNFVALVDDPSWFR